MLLFKSLALTFTYSKSTGVALEKDAKYVQN